MTELYPTFRFGSLDLTSYPFAVPFGRDFGNPKGIVADVISALTDGSLVQRTGTENREVTIPVMIEGADHLELAEAEALLVAEANKERNEFTFNPGDGFAFDSVLRHLRGRPGAGARRHPRPEPRADLLPDLRRVPVAAVV